MARFKVVDGHRVVVDDRGREWLRGEEGGYWACRDVEAGVTYELEKRRRNVADGCPDTGWYLFSDEVGGFFGEWCGRLVLEAVAEASRLIG